MGSGEVLYGELSSLHMVMSLRSLQVSGLEGRNTELEAEESKDTLEPTRTKQRSSVLTISGFNDVGNLQKLALVVKELHRHLAQNMKLRKIQQGLRSLQAQNPPSQASSNE